MNAISFKSTMLSLAIAGLAAAADLSASTSLSEMTAAEIISLLPCATNSSEAGDNVKGDAIKVSGKDLLTKAYGTLEAVNSGEGTITSAEAKMNITPSQEDEYLWLDASNGYLLNYKGMQPEVSALVRLENDSICDYGFFFLFPYSENEKERIKFSTSMLEDFENLGADLGANPYTSDLFEVGGDYSDNYLAMRLIDDADGERYILFLSVEPNAISAADKEIAEL